MVAFPAADSDGKSIHSADNQFSEAEIANTYLYLPATLLMKVLHSTIHDSAESGDGRFGFCCSRMLVDWVFDKLQSSFSNQFAKENTTQLNTNCLPDI